MTCDDCDQPATVRLPPSEKTGGVAANLCEACAAKRGVTGAGTSLMIAPTPPPAPVAVVSTDLAKLACPTCGMRFMDFRKQGRLGCPRDYEVFRVGLLPLLDRVHRETHHVGKRPRRSADATLERLALAPLRASLRQAIAEERFEDAARLRDEIRAKESPHGA